MATMSDDFNNDISQALEAAGEMDRIRTLAVSFVAAAAKEYMGEAEHSGDLPDGVSLKQTYDVLCDFVLWAIGSAVITQGEDVE